MRACGLLAGSLWRWMSRGCVGFEGARDCFGAGSTVLAAFSSTTSLCRINNPFSLLVRLDVALTCPPPVPSRVGLVVVGAVVLMVWPVLFVFCTCDCGFKYDLLVAIIVSLIFTLDSPVKNSCGG
ncbi:hypothetical protein JCM6882_008375 [Rhodosporidiobolus microsporus]